jgi:DNA topoisomerase-1
VFSSQVERVEFPARNLFREYVTLAQAEMREEAKDAGLRYTTDEQPGYSRKRHGDSFFTYCLPDGRKIKDRATLDRIKELVVPPAWEEVWICSSTNGHIQATGRDARKRKQYIYHPKWRDARDETKFEHMRAFARALPKIRRRVAADLRRKELDYRKIVATVVRLLEATVIRVGNDEYARENGSYGLTTMRNRHVKVHRSEIAFSFKGKSGKQHEITLEDKRLAKIVRACQELPGQQLFSYVENGDVRHIGSADVNEYLQEITGSDFTAKDFRTWIATVLAATAFRELEAVTSATQAKKNIRMVIESVSKILGNTPTICRKSYVHPDIINAYVEGDTLLAVSQQISNEVKPSLNRLKPIEAAVLSLLQRRLKKIAHKNGARHVSRPVAKR